MPDDRLAQAEGEVIVVEVILEAETSVMVCDVSSFARETDFRDPRRVVLPR